MKFVFIGAIALAAVAAIVLAGGCAVSKRADASESAGNGVSAYVPAITDMIDDIEAIRPRPTLVVEISSRIFYASLADSPAAKELVEKLSPAPLTLELSDSGGFGKVGDLPWTLTERNERLTTRPGDIVLYEGNKLALYYGENIWSLTRLASIGGATKDELLAALGDGDATVKLWLEWSE